MDNFKCNKCGKSIYVPYFKMIFSNGEMVETDKRGNPIECCGQQMDFIGQKKDFKNIGFNFFNSMSNEQKKAVLKKRAKDNFKGHRKEQYEHINKNFKGFTKDL